MLKSFDYSKLFVSLQCQTNTKDMKKVTTLKEKVIARLVKNGCNQENATTWTNEHFEYVSEHYRTVGQMANVIMSL